MGHHHVKCLCSCLAFVSPDMQGPVMRKILYTASEVQVHPSSQACDHIAGELWLYQNVCPRSVISGHLAFII
jgi:hypothetical protein